MKRKPKSLKSKYDFDAWIEEEAGLNDKRKGWVEGDVDQSEPFFLVVASSTPAALVGQTPKQFVVQWLCDDEAVREQTRQKLDFFLTNEGTEAMQRMGKWRYMIYSAVATSANFYSRVQLRFIEPPRTIEQILQSSASSRGAAPREVINEVVREGTQATIDNRPKVRPTDPSPTALSGQTLQETTRAGDLDRVGSLLSHGADVNALDEHGLTALHHAAAHNQLEMARALLVAGADVNAQSFEQVRGFPSAVGRGKCETPWHKAQSREMKNLLVEHGAATNTKPLLNLTTAQITAAQMNALRKQRKST